MTLDLASLLTPLNELAAVAAARIMSVYASAFTVQEKSDASPLTAADLASHEAIVAGLQRLTPEIPVLSEESSTTIPLQERATWDRFWLVDPLDGTKEFIKRNGEFTVNIALIEKNAPVLGVVRVPVSGVSYFAARGCGAFRQEPGQEPVRITVRPLAPGPVRVMGSRSHGGEGLRRFVAGLGEYTLLTIGSSLKFCMVAAGEADVYPRLGPTWGWDTAAAQSIVEEAGGQVIDTLGQRLCYNKESLLNSYFLVIGDANHDWLSHLPDDVRS